MMPPCTVTEREPSEFCFVTIDTSTEPPVGRLIVVGLVCTGVPLGKTADPTMSTLSVEPMTDWYCGNSIKNRSVGKSLTMKCSPEVDKGTAIHSCQRSDS